MSASFMTNRTSSGVLRWFRLTTSTSSTSTRRCRRLSALESSSSPSRVYCRSIVDISQSLHPGSPSKDYLLWNRRGCLAMHKRQLSSEAAVAAASEPAEDSAETPSTEELVFVNPKSKELFEKITTQCESVEDVKRLADLVNGILGRPLRQNEFYYDGFGGVGGGAGRRAGGGGEAGASGEEGEASAAAEEKSTVDLKLVGFDAKAKIKVIKEVRAILPELGLKEAKELVEGAPKVIQRGIKPEQAKELQERLQAVGAEVELA